MLPSNALFTVDSLPLGTLYPSLIFWVIVKVDNQRFDQYKNARKSYNTLAYSHQRIDYNNKLEYLRIFTQV